MRTCAKGFFKCDYSFSLLYELVEYYPHSMDGPSQNEMTSVLPNSNVSYDVSDSQIQNDNKCRLHSLNISLQDKPLASCGPISASIFRELSMKSSRQFFLTNPDSATHFRDLVVNLRVYEVAACLIRFVAFWGASLEMPVPCQALFRSF